MLDSVLQTPVSLLQNSSLSTLEWTLRDVQEIAASLLIGFYMFPVVFTLAYCCSLIRTACNNNKDGKNGGPGGGALSRRASESHRHRESIHATSSSRGYKFVFCLAMLVNFGYRLSFFVFYVISQFPSLDLPQDHSFHIVMCQSVNFNVCLILLGLLMLFGFGEKYVMSLFGRKARKCIGICVGFGLALAIVYQIVCIALDFVLWGLELEHTESSWWIPALFYTLQNVVLVVLSILTIVFLVWVVLFFQKKVRAFASGLQLWGSGMLSVPSKADRAEFAFHIILLCIVSLVRCIYNVVMIVSLFTYARETWSSRHVIGDCVVDIVNFLFLTFVFDVPLFLGMLYVWRSDDNEFLMQCLLCCDCSSVLAGLIYPKKKNAEIPRMVANSIGGGGTDIQQDPGGGRIRDRTIDTYAGD